MCAFWNKWFKKEEEPTRVISHPRQLNAADLVQIDDSFSLPEDIRGASLVVQNVGTYQFEFEQSPVWTLKGEKGLIYLSIENDSGSDQISFSKRLQKAEVESWFDPDQFARIFEEDYDLRLSPLKQEGDFSSWVDGDYGLKTFALSGYFYDTDYRGQKAPQYEGSGEPFDYYCLENEAGTHAIEIEVYQDGTTEVSASQYLDMGAIKDMWPGK